MALGYRTILTADADAPALERILDVLRRWVIGKGFPSLPTQGAVANSRGSSLAATIVRSSDRVAFRWRLEEQWNLPPRRATATPSGPGITTITISYADGSLTLWVDIEPPMLRYTDARGRERTELQESGTPRFVRDLIGELSFRDGLAEPMDGFQVATTIGHAQELAGIVQDDERRSAVYVTVPPRGTLVEEWRARAEQLVGRVQGMGLGYVLDMTAAEAFNAHAGYEHAVPKGAMRTFLPGARFRDVGDAYRHKLLHASTIQTTDPRRLERALRAALIDRLGDARLPDFLREIDYELQRQARLRPFVDGEVDVETEARPAETLEHYSTYAAEAGPETATEPQERILELEAIVDDLRSKLAEAEKAALGSFEENFALQDELETVRKERDDARDDADITFELLTDALDVRDAAQSAARQYWNALWALGSQEAYAAAALEQAPERQERPHSFAEIAERISGLAGVQYVGDADDIRDLDEQSALGTAAIQRAWDALLTFDAYVSTRVAGNFDGGLRHYCGDSSHGGLMRISDVVWNESDTVLSNAEMRRERTVVVPVEVDPSGERILEAHVRVAARGGYPRIYFEDAFISVGKVLVGYFGVHLRNTRTN